MYTIQVDLEKCQGCGDCVDVCPVEVLELRTVDGKEYAFYKGAEDECIGCLACESECPESAMSVVEA